MRGVFVLGFATRKLYTLSTQLRRNANTVEKLLTECPLNGSVPPNVEKLLGGSGEIRSRLSHSKRQPTVSGEFDVPKECMCPYRAEHRQCHPDCLLVVHMFGSLEASKIKEKRNVDTVQPIEQPDERSEEPES